MRSQYLLQLLLCVILFTLAESGRTSYKIWKVARNYRESSKWSVWSSWGWRVDFFGKNKCNLFVYDVLNEAGAKAPNRKPGKISPIGANEWANPRSTYVKNTGCYSVVSFGQKRRGDIIAFGRYKTSGHVGIVSLWGNYISAGRYRIVEKSIPNMNGTSIIRTTVWRYTC
uniref:Peptidase C51 domain-containing protein n=1 Tax=Magallana gigas TaxID=29159 RepID=A0A8W8MN59_MAGGI|nr:uncharacterized protein LOC105344934 [Crassostrea gigas]